MLKLRGMQTKMVNCDILLRENRRTLCITIGKNAEVIVKAPYKLSDNEINNFIAKKSKWIERHTERINNNKKVYADIVNLNNILYFNDLYKVVETSIKNATLQDETLFIKSCQTIEKRKNEIKKWFISTAKEILKKRLDYFARIMQLQYNTFKLTNAKNKWGSCSTRKEIMLNWRLIMLESELQDYVIVHELCHLLEMNHSNSFYKCIEAIIPNYKSIRKKIKNANFILQLYR